MLNQSMQLPLTPRLRLPPLSPDERAQLAEHERVIGEKIEAFYEVGARLATIRDLRLYRETHTSFASYLTERWGMGKTKGNGLIAASRVYNNLSANADTPLPANPSQAEALAPLTDEQQRIAWAVVTQTAPGGVISESHIKRVAAVLESIVITDAVDNGDGGQVAINDLVTAAITQETYEAMQRQREHINSTSKRRLVARSKAMIRTISPRGDQIEITITVNAADFRPVNPITEGEYLYVSLSTERTPEND